MSPKQDTQLTALHKWVTVTVLPVCFALLVYIAKGVYETGQENSRSLAREHQKNEDQDQRLNQHDNQLVNLNNYLRESK